MSEQTYDALLQAVTDHVLDEASFDPEVDTDIVRDWVLVASTVGMDDSGDEVEIFVHRSPSTALYAVTGLLEWGKAMYREVEE